MAIVGYARVSTSAQDLALQLDALRAAGAVRIFEEHAGGTKQRPQLDAAMEYVRAGDTLLVWRLDRLGRSVIDLVHRLARLNELRVELRSVSEPAYDTTTPSGRFLFHIAAAFAEMERWMIRDRALAGLAAARARGRVAGRPFKTSPAKREMILALYDAKTIPVQDICREHGISRTTIQRYARDRHRHSTTKGNAA